MTTTTPVDRKQQIVDTFSRVANVFDNPSQRYFPFCADRIVHVVKPRRGEKLLDVGTGTGAVATAAAQLLQPQGRVTAIDLSEPMLLKAEANARKMALDNIDFHLMDGEHLEFRNNYFDAVTGSYCLFMFDDMPAALQQWKRVLKPGGRLVFSSFSSSAFQPYVELFLDSLRRLGGNTNIDEEPRLNTIEECETLLSTGGLTQISVQPVQLGYHMKSSADWWEIITSSGLRGVLDTLGREQQEQLRQQHCSEIDKFATDKGLWLDVETLISYAEKPADQK